MIEGLVDGGTTVLLTTQYLEEADRLARRVAVVDHGRVIADGTPAQLKADLGTTVLDVGLPDEATALGAAEILAEVGTKPPSLNGSSIEIPVDDGPRAAMEALRMLDARAVSPTTFVLREPSLDDVFLALTGKRTDADIEDPDAPPGGTGRGRGRGRARAESTTGGAR
jgi:ABC-type multidrug transport system ATPase subunit